MGADAAAVRSAMWEAVRAREGAAAAGPCPVCQECSESIVAQYLSVRHPKWSARRRWRRNHRKIEAGLPGLGACRCGGWAKAVERGYANAATVLEMETR